MGITAISTATLFPASGTYSQAALSGPGLRQTDSAAPNAAPSPRAQGQPAAGRPSSGSETKNAGQTDANNTAPTGIKELTKEQQQVVEKLKATDTAVRAHELAHIAVGGRYITSGASFQFQQGPDGKTYAVGGEVSIDASPVPNDPQATISKMETVREAALAPAQPSAQDRAVAAQATQAENRARMELIINGEKNTVAASTPETKTGSAVSSQNFVPQGANGYSQGNRPATGALISRVG
jgi:hypothetical protein